MLHLVPKDTPPFMRQAWLDCLDWAIRNEDVMAQFRRDTGNRWTPGRSGIEQAIDKATGADRAFIEAFVVWFNANVWGTDEE